ncbi:MAG TPA: nucleotide pyrophosphohydrolase [Candidatus Saccharimonadales bacterium]|nr:nucleotide pyrophosphohydrolase [Candidatus Saccharimonadales bacterium]
MSRGKQDNQQGDPDTTIQELKDLIAQFAAERDWERHHTPKNLALSISIEAAELLEHFQWDEYHQDDKEAMASELADILAYAFNFANVMDIDVASAFRKKLEKVNKKYPVEIFNKNNVGKDDFFRIKKEYRKKGKS